jgi:hypothetical protein
VTAADASTAAAAAGALVSELLLLPPLRGNRAVCSDILCEHQWRVGEQHGGHGWLPVAPLQVLRWLLLLLRVLLL